MVLRSWETDTEVGRGDLNVGFAVCLALACCAFRSRYAPERNLGKREASARVCKPSGLLPSDRSVANTVHFVLVFLSVLLDTNCVVGLFVVLVCDRGIWVCCMTSLRWPLLDALCCDDTSKTAVHADTDATAPADQSGSGGTERRLRIVLDGWSQEQTLKTRRGVRELDKVDADLVVDVGGEEDGDPAAAGEPPTTKLQRGDLPKKNLLNTMSSKPVEAGTKAVLDKDEHDMVTKCLVQVQALIRIVRTRQSVSCRRVR